MPVGNVQFRFETDYLETALHSTMNNNENNRPAWMCRVYANVTRSNYSVVIVLRNTSGAYEPPLIALDS